LKATVARFTADNKELSEKLAIVMTLGEKVAKSEAELQKQNTLQHKVFLPHYIQILSASY
jgi:hypothetical protein